MLDADVFVTSLQRLAHRQFENALPSRRIGQICALRWHGLPRPGELLDLRSDRRRVETSEHSGRTSSNRTEHPEGKVFGTDVTMPQPLRFLARGDKRASDVLSEVVGECHQLTWDLA